MYVKILTLGGDTPQGHSSKLSERDLSMVIAMDGHQCLPDNY